MAILERFLSKVDKQPDGCWLWVAGGAGHSNEYGGFSLGGRTQLAHRVAYELFVDEIPEGLHVLHDCDVKRCVNPKHLWLGTHNDNIQDARYKGMFEGNGAETSLSSAAILEIIESRGKILQKDLAVKFGISRTHVGAIQRGERCKLE